ncbi:MAG: hypothetical protein SNJ84_02890 [Verrucomicrobiia bacterium]
MADPKILQPELVDDAAPQTPRPEGPLIHPLAAICMVVVDLVWTLPEVAGFLIPVIFLSLLSVGTITFLIQKFIRGDPNGRACAIALFLGVLAAVPTPITGTAVGILVLGMAGLHHLAVGKLLPGFGRKK